MRGVCASVLVLLLAVLAATEAAEIPAPRGYVNDYADMISSSVKANLTAKLKAFEETDSTQFVILTVPSLGGEPVEDFSIKVAEAWKIGQKGKDNGILFLVSKEDRKMRIEVGRGLEGKLTDLMAGRIIDLVVKPKFRAGDYDGGFTAGVSAVIDATRGEFAADRRAPRATYVPYAGGLSPWVAFLILIGIFIIFAAVARSHDRREKELRSRGRRREGSRGGFPFFPGGYYGGGWSSGGGGSGSGSGGGFSGGGGSFGGGGASGDW